MKKYLLLVLATIILMLCVVALSFQTQAQSGNQWRADFYDNPNWSGNPVYSLYSNWVSFSWDDGAPAFNVPADEFSGRFTTAAFFYAGTYRFTLLADDEFVLIIDGVTYADTRDQGLSGKTLALDIALTQGTHQIQVDYREIVLTAYVFVNWQYLKPAGGVPPPTPYPVATPLPYPMPPLSASSVVTVFGDYTPCIQSNLHQANCFQANGQWESPNLGSIQMEPQIAIWGNCEPADSDVTWVVDPTTDPPRTQGYRCSKTLAGWFLR
jgi:hypothetical protein